MRKAARIYFRGLNLAARGMTWRQVVVYVVLCNLQRCEVKLSRWFLPVGLLNDHGQSLQAHRLVSSRSSWACATLKQALLSSGRCHNHGSLRRRGGNGARKRLWPGNGLLRRRLS